MRSLHDSPQAPLERTLGPDSPPWFQGPWVTPFVCSTTTTQRSGEGPFLGPRCPPLPGLPMPCWRVRSGPELVRWLGKGEGTEGSPAWWFHLPARPFLTAPSSMPWTRCLCMVLLPGPSLHQLRCGRDLPCGDPGNLQDSSSPFRGAQSPIPSMEPRSSVPQPSVGPPNHSPFPRAQESLSLPRGPELSPHFMRSSCHLEPER